MSPQLYVSAGAVLTLSLAMGLGLGHYVTSPQKSVARDSVPIETVRADSSPIDAPSAGGRTGPAIVRCIGCGPTLAERRWEADMAGISAIPASDAEDDAIGVDDRTTDSIEVMPGIAPPSPLRSLPPQMARFAAGDAPAPLPVTITSGEQNMPPPGEAAATTESPAP